MIGNKESSTLRIRFLKRLGMLGFKREAMVRIMHSVQNDNLLSLVIDMEEKELTADMANAAWSDLWRHAHEIQDLQEDAAQGNTQEEQETMEQGIQ